MVKISCLFCYPFVCLSRALGVLREPWSSYSVSVMLVLRTFHLAYNMHLIILPVVDKYVGSKITSG